MMEQGIHPTLDHDEIVDGIFIGTNQCCQTHFDERLLKLGIEADISLEEERIDAPFGVQFYIWLPVTDRHAPTQAQLELGATVLEKLVALGKRVYVHCKKGHGRAPTLVAAYLMRQGKSLTEALRIIALRRPAIHLTEVQREALKTFR